jgi:hypothetical protein
MRERVEVPLPGQHIAFVFRDLLGLAGAEYDAQIQ